MDTIAAGRTELYPPPQEARVNPEKHASSIPSTDRFAEARMAKKKQKRARHRARLRRSHTNG